MEGGDFRLRVDTVLTAVGEDPELEALPVPVGERSATTGLGLLGSTGAPEWFAGGDVAGDERSVAAALGAGKRGAIAIDRFLRDRAIPLDGMDGLRWAGGAFALSRWRGDDPVPRTDPRDEVVGPDDLTLAHFAPAPRHAESWRAASLGFDEVNLGLPLSTAIDEARRCLNCGVCNDCELCMILCPDVAIAPAAGGHGFVIDLDHCKGCGICAEECPRGAIVMTREGL
mgnify:CR=1 FL=1